ncbi:MAG: hypothetical protein JWM19_4940 [Actinomycetia bacterium]|nr:hypothetical protein [Actinomycetes bacterium]
MPNHRLRRRGLARGTPSAQPGRGSSHYRPPSQGTARPGTPGHGDHCSRAAPRRTTPQAGAIPRHRRRRLTYHYYLRLDFDHPLRAIRKVTRTTAPPVAEAPPARNRAMTAGFPPRASSSIPPRAQKDYAQGQHEGARRPPLFCRAQYELPERHDLSWEVRVITKREGGGLDQRWPCTSGEQGSHSPTSLVFPGKFSVNHQLA